MIFSIHNQDYGRRLAHQKYHRNVKSVKIRIEALYLYM